MNMPEEFTSTQIRQYLAYEKIRAGGRFNMFDPRATRATGLSEEEYVFIMTNYAELQKQHEKEKK